ncbi:MAG: hypothetical protein M3134_09300, partial [Actinomycetota bacterium]|nr:hypothetical protein [Actinomycetota bacterium]
PGEVRTRVAAGFREGRSPDLLAVAAEGGLLASEEGPKVPWPSTSGGSTRVPIAFFGEGVNGAAKIPDETGLDDVAPTVEAILGLDRPHPDVRSGTAVEDVATGEPPRLVVEVVWVGRGSDDLERARVAAEATKAGASTFEGDTVSVPVDPAAVLTTIGTGGRPSQHGITGTHLRDDAGKLRAAWSERSPVSVIATLGDDLDEELGEKPEIGIVAARRSYLGAIGGNWYIDVDRDRFVRTRRGREARDARTLLDGPFGADEVPDLAVVVVESGPKGLDAVFRTVLERGAAVSGGSVAFVFTATGRTGGDRAFEPPAQIASLVERVVPGGLFLDQKELARQQVSEDEILRALTRDPVFADAFPAIAVAFGRYC